MMKMITVMITLKTDYAYVDAYHVDEYDDDAGDDCETYADADGDYDTSKFNIVLIPTLRLLLATTTTITTTTFFIESRRRHL